MKKMILFFIVITGIAITSFAQKQAKSKIDSLFSVLESAKPDTAKVSTLNALAFEFADNNPDTSIYYASEAQALAIKLNYKIGIANAYLTIGNALINLGNYEKALKNINDALMIYDQILPMATGTEKTGDKLKIMKKKAGVYNYIGVINLYQGNYPGALKSFFTSI